MMLDGVALIAGLFLAPLGLLALGHRFRGLSARRRRLFWGATIGYLVGMAVAGAAMMTPPVLWTEGPALRAAAVYWAMPAGLLLGALMALISAPRGAERAES